MGVSGKDPFEQRGVRLEGLTESGIVRRGRTVVD